MNKVIFIAADPKHRGFMAAQFEYTTQHGGMNKAQLNIDHEINKGNVALAVWYNGKSHPFMSSMNTGQIYIRGHGMPGFVSIEMARGGERIHYTDVVDRMIKSGLKKAFGGDIKCYNCHSAENGVPGDDPEIEDGTPFAQYIADELYNRGYKSCRIFGYTDAIDSNPKSAASVAMPGEVLHKYRRGKGGAGNYGRASSGRVEFVGRPKPAKPKKPNIFQQLWKHLSK